MAPPIEDLEDHLRVAGILTVAVGALSVLAYIISLLVLGFVLFPAGGDGQAGTWLILGAHGLLALGAWAVLTGTALFARKAWAKTSGRLLGLLLLPAIPFLTMVGGYLLWVLTRPGVEAVLTEPARTDLPGRSSS